MDAVPLPDFFGEWALHVKRFGELLEGESHRGAAVLARGYLEAAIEELLLLSGLRYADSDKRKSIGRALSGGLDAKIEMCKRLGILNEHVCKSANEIRELGNRFAHQPRIKTFADARVSQILVALARRQGDDFDIQQVGSAQPIDPTVGIRVLQEAMSECMGAILEAHENLETPDQTTDSHV